MQAIREFSDIVMADLLIIALDIEHCQQDPLRFEVGVAVLDTRDLTLAVSGRRKKRNIISTRNFYVVDLVNRLYLKEVSKNFKFGDSESLRPHELEPTLRSIISDRRFALIFRNRHGDIQFLGDLQIHLEPDYLFDTNDAAREILGFGQRHRLGDLVAHLLALDIPRPSKFFHNAGNDTNVTLRAFMMLIVLESLNSSTTGFSIDKSTRDVPQQLAQQPTPGLEMRLDLPLDQRPKPNPPTQEPEEKRRRRREKHERKALMKERKEPWRAQKIAEKLASTREARLVAARM